MINYLSGEEQNMSDKNNYNEAVQILQENEKRKKNMWAVQEND
jgi:hypothetical protein